MAMKTALLWLLFGLTPCVIPLYCKYWQTEDADIKQSSFVCNYNSSSPIFGFNASQVQNVTILYLYCTGNTLEASKWGELLLKFNNLEELWTQSCDIELDDLSSLKRLHSLSVTRQSVMKFHRSGFEGFTSLRNVDLSYNNIGGIRSYFFCSSNTFDTTTCDSPLETLDMSNNEIVDLSEHMFAGLVKLQKLFLQNNHISTIHENAFIYLYDLKVLSLASNALTTLPSSVFQFTGKIKYLFLGDNSLEFLPLGVLRTLNQLETLDLSLNKLTNEWTKKDPVLGLNKLRVLNLSHNNLTEIDSILLKNQKNLEFLSFEHNQIYRIADDAFTSLKNLRSFTLAYNNIVNINDVFSNMLAMNQLFLDHNKIKKINKRSFESLPNLNDLCISGNQLIEVPEAVRALERLILLDLGSNNITYLRKQQFKNLHRLNSLVLVDNKIKTINKSTFENLLSLQTLYLSHNVIQQIEKAAFACNKHLTGITVDNNELIDLNGIFSGIQSLFWLNVAKNKLKRFDYSDIPLTLQWLNIHGNNITKLEDRNNVREIHDLRILNISYNQLQSIDDFSFPNEIEHVVLNNNNIERIFPGTFFKKHKLREVILNSNKLKTLEDGAISLSTQINATTTPEFYLSDNPFECDCNLEWLQGENQFYNQTQYPMIMDLENIRCDLKTKLNIGVTELTLDFLCQYETYCPSICNCCGFIACDCELICSDNCKCYRDFTWNRNIVDCSRAKYDSIPKNIPMDATEIRLDGNNLTELKNNMFLGKFLLQILYLNSSNIAIVNNQTFNSLRSLRVLHLENNSLKQLNGNIFKGLATLQLVLLNDNKIGKIENDTFQVLPSLKFLNLDNNGNVEFMPWHIGYKKHMHVSLDGIYWICDCKDLKLLNQWLLLNVTENIMCYRSDDKLVNTTITTVSKECEMMTSTNISICLTILIALIVILIIIVVVYYWCVYKKRLSDRHLMYREVAVSDRTQDDEIL